MGATTSSGADLADRPVAVSMVISGHNVGHIGAVDIIAGFDRLITPPAD